MTILCAWLPDFIPTIHRRRDPAGSRRPLVVATPTPARVYAACAGAIRLGVQPGMSLAQVHSLAPTALIVPAAPTTYQTVRETILNALSDFSPYLELSATSQGERCYLSLTETSRTAIIDLARLAGRTIRQVAHPAPALGLAKGKFPALVAARLARSNYLSLKAWGRETAFLAPLPIAWLPLDPLLAWRLALLGLRTMGQLAALPRGAVLTQFGPEGGRLQQLARGRDEHPVQPYTPQPTIDESYTFDGPVDMQAPLAAGLHRLVDRLADRLAENNQATQQVQLILHLADDGRWSEGLALRRATAAPERLLGALLGLLNRAKIDCGVVQITIRLETLQPHFGEQLDLFVHAGAQQHRLQEMLADLTTRHGPDVFYQPLVVDPGAALPEQRFQLAAVSR